MVHLLTLGATDLRRDEIEVRSVLSQPKRLAVLVYLATASPRGFHSRDTLLAKFWPESSEERARNSLRQALHYLRRSLGDDVIVNRGDHEVGIDPTLIRCDAAAFDDAIAAGHLEEALTLYRGDFMPGFFIEEAPDAEEWLDAERRRRRVAALGAALTLSRQEEARGERQSALLWARRAVAIAPEDEEARRRVGSLERSRLEVGEREKRSNGETADRAQHGAHPEQAAVSPVEQRLPTLRVGRHHFTLSPKAKRAHNWLRFAAVAIVASGVLIGAYAWFTRDSVTAVTGDAAAVAVLPFVNISGDTANEYFSDGITEEILNSLAQVEGLRVAARTSSFAYKGKDRDVREIAKQLGVTTVLEGSVRKMGDTVRITAQLIDARTGYHLSSQTYDRELRDVFKLQAEVAQAISQALQLRVQPKSAATLARRPTSSSEAYDLYLRGKHLMSITSRERNELAIDYLQRAVTEDPEFAQAHAALASAYIRMGEFVPAREVLPRARDAALRALQLDSSLVDTRLALADVLQVYERDWPAAERQIKLALRLDPASAQAHSAYAYFLLDSRRFKEAEAVRRRAWELRRREATDSTLPAFRMEQMVAWAGFYMHVGDFERAHNYARAALDLDPANHTARWVLAMVYQETGRYEQAVAELERIRREAFNAQPYLTHLGRAYASAGRAAEARAILDTLQARARVTYVPKDQIALLHYALGDTTQALVWLERAIDEHHWWLPNTNGHVLWRGLWEHPGFQQLMRKLGAPPAN